MLLDELVEKLQAKLVENNRLLENIDAEREMIEKVSQEEVLKITAECDAIKERVISIGKMSQKKAQIVFSDLDRMLLDRREVVRTGSLVLCPEIEKIGKDVAAKDLDLEESWEKVKEVVESELPDVDVTVPQFFPSSSLSTIKNSDIGFICLAEFPPNQFEVIIVGSPMRQLTSESNTMKVFCMIKTDQMFTENIQNHVKFSIKNLNSKNPVSYCNEDCRMAEDKKSFCITFLATESGKYKVTALLYGEHITSSPLIIPVSVLKTSLAEKKDEEIKANSDHNNNASQIYLDPSILTAPPQSSLPSTPLDLQGLYRDQGKLTCYKVFSIESGSKPGNICKPIGMCVLQNKNIVVATTFDDKVRMFSPSGNFLSFITLSKAPFSRPTDMLTLHSGEFVVRDDNKVTVFTKEGKFLRMLWQDKGNVKCYGLAQDKEDRVITIMCNRSQRRTELLFFDLTSGELVRKIDMVDIIAEKDKSKCRFLTYQLGNLYITDLGLDCVYVLDPATTTVKVFGKSGSGDGQFSDPAGLVVDCFGNIVVADSRNHRLCLFTNTGKFLCKVGLSPEASRPSGVVLDSKNKELYVLNLWGKNAMIKYRFSKVV